VTTWGENAVLPRWVGRQVDDFVIEDRIVRGGMATVFRAHQVSINRYIALKIIDLSPNQEERDEFRKRFAQEATVVALLEHIHILPIYAYGIVDNEFAYLAMRLLRGGSLSDVLRKGPLPMPRAADIFTQVGRGLQYAHSKGVIHRDLKPSNILLDDGGNAYLSDFGLAKMGGSTINLTKSGNLVGTPAYVAPEQVRGEVADARSDIYSLGILLYHMLVGRPPFELSEQGIAALLYKHVEEAPIPPHLLNPSITPEVEAVILRALEKDPSQRYQSAEEMVQDFNLALGRKTRLRSFMTLRTPERLKLINQNRQVTIRRVILAILLMIVLTVGAIAIFGARSHVPDKPVWIAAGIHGTIADVTPNDSEIAAAKARLGDKGLIAFLACTLDNVTQATRAREMGDMAAAYGLAYKVYNANNDASTQVTQFEQARLDGAKAVILCPLNTTALNDSIQSLKAANIPLAYITLFDNPYGVQQDSSSYDIGVVVGKLAGQIYNEEHSTPPQVVVLSYAGFPATESRDDGMEAGFKQTVPSVNFIGRVPGYTEDDAYKSIQGLIQKKTHFDVILSINDVGAYGAVKAMQEANFDPKSVIIVSANGESYAQELIRQGQFLRGTVTLNRQQSSQIAVDSIVKMLAGSEVPQIVSYPPGDVLTREVLMATGS